MRPESPYRRPARHRRPPVDVWGAACAFACLVMFVVGFGVGVGGASEMRHGSSPAVPLVGLALMLAAVGGAVRLARRGV